MKTETKIRCLLDGAMRCRLEAVPEGSGRLCSLEAGVCKHQSISCKGNGRAVDYYARKAVRS